MKQTLPHPYDPTLPQVAAGGVGIVRDDPSTLNDLVRCGVASSRTDPSTVPPTIVVVAGHKTGTFLLMDIFEHVVRETSLPVHICVAPNTTKVRRSSTPLRREHARLCLPPRLCGETPVIAWSVPLPTAPPTPLPPLLPALRSPPTALPRPIALLGGRATLPHTPHTIHTNHSCMAAHASVCVRAHPSQLEGLSPSGEWRWRVAPWFRDSDMNSWADTRSEQYRAEHLGLCPQLSWASKADPYITQPSHASVMMSFDLGAEHLKALLDVCAEPTTSASLFSPVLACATSAQPFIMVRLVRDPRDIIMSGFHHHRSFSPKEVWLADSRYEKGILDNSSFGCRLSEMRTEEDGLLLEMEVARRHWLGNLIGFIDSLDTMPPRIRDNIHFVRYEDLWWELESTINDLSKVLFPRNDQLASEWAIAAIEKQGGTLCTAFGRCGRCALTISACEEGNEQRAGTTEHLHKGNPGQWKPGFSLRHHERFAELGLNRLGN